MHSGETAQASGAEGLLASMVLGIVAAAAFVLLAESVLLWGVTIGAALGFAFRAFLLYLNGGGSRMFLAPDSVQTGPAGPWRVAFAVGDQADALTNASAIEDVAAPAAIAVPEEAASDVQAVEEIGQGKPLLLSEPRGSRPDDLKMINGVGSKLESLLHASGIYHLDQIAAWTGAEVEWIDAHMRGVSAGRIARDDWVAQARALVGCGSPGGARSGEEN